VPVRFRPRAPSFVAVKILAVKNNNTLRALVAEAFNDVGTSDRSAFIMNANLSKMIDC